MSKGQVCKLLVDDWDLYGKLGVVVDAEPVPGSTQCIVCVDDECITVSRLQLELVR